MKRFLFIVCLLSSQTYPMMNEDQSDQKTTSVNEITPIDIEQGFIHDLSDQSLINKMRERIYNNRTLCAEITCAGCFTLFILTLLILTLNPSH